MIEIGYKFPHNGAVVLASAPADANSIIVLCKEKLSQGRAQYITGRVYALTLPHPTEWDNGTYSQTLDEAVHHFMHRSLLGLPKGGIDQHRIRAVVLLAEKVEKRLAETQQTPDLLPVPPAEQVIYDALVHMDAADAKDITAHDLTASLREKGLLAQSAAGIEVAVKDSDSGPYADSTLTMPDGGTARVLLYRSPVVEHGVSVQVETDELISHIRVMLNDGDLFAGNPEEEN